ncbi:fungal-specific transcription factor domain-containing protein [Aspergillus granulosus]|uniref:Fungal-specific transcription factor domain-containing protein n=1 Tax=Aspergillus granulosus TaxID=176169 RepID=A0ABR4GV39_9EURO
MDQPTRTRKRVPKSCRRCHRRKQRCIGFPTCANCAAANEPCLRSETSLSWHHGMSKGALAHRIEILEAHLSAAIPDGLPSPSGVGAEEDLRSPEGTATRSIVTEEHVDAEVPRDRKKPKATAYFGPSSGVTIKENLSRIVDNGDAWAGRPILINGTGEQEGPISPAPTAEQGKAAPPDDAIGRQLLDTYFNTMHMRLPLVDRAEILQLHARRYATPAGADQQHNQYGMFKLFMVYAIGAAMLQLSDQQQHELMTPGAYFATALEFDGAAVREALSAAGVEGRMLMVMYELRSNSGSGVWFTIGMAMRLCIDLGMHRESHYRVLSPQESQLRRRLFWCVYVVERHVSWALGRPFSIAEDEIDTQIPADVDDLSIVDRSRIQPGRVGIPAIRRFIATVQLQRVMSRIHTKIYGVDRNMSALVPQLPSLLALLEEYRAGLPPLEPRDSDFIRMHWNNCVRVLLQPFLSILDPDDDRIRTCLHASGQMCQFFKRSQQKGISGYSFLLANSVYLAGLTMCFCLFRSPRSWTTSVANDLRACSSAIFVMAERIPNFRKPRDDLENMINRAMDFVHEVSTQSPHVSSQPATSVEGLQAGQLANNENSLDLRNMSIPETQGQENSLFGGFLTEDFWTAETLNLPTLNLFDLGWNGQGYQQ